MHARKFDIKLDNIPYSYRDGDGLKCDAVVRCNFCNKFMQYKKYRDNGLCCYHCNIEGQDDVV